MGINFKDGKVRLTQVDQNWWDIQTTQVAIISVDKREGKKPYKALKFALQTVAGFEKTRASSENCNFQSRWTRMASSWNLFPERPCMCFGSDVVVSCLCADAARFKMDACMFVCLRLCWGSSSAKGQKKHWESLRHFKKDIWTEELWGWRRSLLACTNKSSPPPPLFIICDGWALLDIR